MKQQAAVGWQSFDQRLLGSLRLSGETFREIARSRDALPQAAAVILLGSLASAAAYLIGGESPSLGFDVDWGSYPITRESNLAAAVAGAVLDAGWGLLIWAAQAALIWLVWNHFSDRTRSWRAIAAPLGFASAPLIVFALLEIVPVVGGLLAFVGLAWTTVASVAALRATLLVGWLRAFLLLVISMVVLLPISLLVTRLL